MTKKIISGILIGAIVLSILAASVLAWQRQSLEAKNKQVELTVEYGEVLQVVQQTGLTYEEVLRQFQQAGITGVFFKEQTLESFSQQVWVKSGSELLADPSLKPEVKQELRAEYTYLLTLDARLAERLARQLEIKANQVQTPANPGGPYLIGTALTRKALEGATAPLGLGYPEEDMAKAENLGLNLQVQVRSWPQAGKDDFRAFFAPLARFKQLDLVLFNDTEIPGFGTKSKIPYLAEELDKLGVPIGLIEFYNQKGFTQLARLLNKNVVRLHSIDPKLMLTMAPDTAVDRYTLAVTDRNIRSLLVRLLLRPDSDSWLESNIWFIGFLQKSIAAQGFTFGQPHVLQGPPYYGLLMLIMGLGVIAGGVLLLRLTGLQKTAYVVGVLAALVWLALLVTGRVLAGSKLMALGAVVVFPSLGVLLNLEEKPATPLQSIWLLLRTSCISLVGALLMVGLLADINFMLKLEQFAGVKLAHVLPLALIAIIAVIRMEKQNTIQRLRQFLNSKITVAYCLLAGVMVVALLIYVMRTGNEAPSVSTLELQLRSWLDKILLVRPRTKEFLIGHPLLLLSFYLGYRHRLLPLLLLGAIGQVSMVNTFAHIHTPLLISLVRAFNGLWAGILLGLLLIMLYRLAAPWGRRLLHG